MIRDRVRRALRFVVTLVLGAILGIGGAYYVTAGRGSQPEAWHQIRPRQELSADRSSEVSDLAAYLRLEAGLFEEVRTELGRQVARYPAFNRFDPASPTHPSRFGRDWNRTWELAPAGPVRGEALLLHGLSDSPYSLRAVGQLLAERGFHVVGLRLPGHGAVPGGLAAVSHEDWRAAVRLGAAATGGRAQATGRPFVIVGYSNGAALALDYTLTALATGQGPVPSRLVFLSPAFAVTPFASLARWQERLSRLPRLGGLAWSEIEPEFDPFKFNSFPIGAAAEIHELTTAIETQLARLESEPAGQGLPPLLTLQSVVDATIPPVASLTRLYSRVRPGSGETELVLFDANRKAGIGSFLGPEANELLALATPGKSFPFRVTLVTNASPDTAEVVARSRAAGSLEATRTPLGLAWPLGVYSLSHVAVPFPPDDPVYGAGTSPAGSPFPLGGLAIKGERGVFLVPTELLIRLRYNPFFDIVRSKILGFVETAAPPAG